MTILWCGGEDIDFPNGSMVTVTGASHARTGFARGAVYCGAYGRSNPFTGGAVTSIRLLFNVYIGWTPAASVLFCGVIKDSESNSGLWIGSSTSSGTKVALFKYDGTTKTQVSAETYNSLVDGIRRIDVEIMNYGSSATINVYCDLALVISYTGDVSISGVSNFSAVGLGGLVNIELSEIIVADEDTRTFSLVTNAPSAAGTTSAWTAGAYTDIDETTINDATVAYTDTADVNQQFNLINTPTGDFSVKAVKIAARATKSADASVGTLKLGINSGGTVNVDAGQSLTTGWGTYERYMQVNPITTNAFTEAEIDALQLNIQSAA